MNKLIIAIMTTLFLASTGTVFAQDVDAGPEKKAQRQHRAKHPNRGAQPMPVTEKFIRAIRRLDLSDEQKENIKSTMKALKEEVKPIMLEMKTGHEQLKGLVNAADYDEQAVAALADNEGMLLAKRIKLTSAALAKARSYLTAEQLTQLDTMAKERKGQRARKGNRDGKGKPPPAEG